MNVIPDRKADRFEECRVCPIKDNCKTELDLKDCIQNLYGTIAKQQSELQDLKAELDDANFALIYKE